jgi:hypothetical protein
LDAVRAPLARRGSTIFDRDEVKRVFLFLVFVLLALVLGVALYVGTLFFQSYIYTEPTPGLAWRAPAAAAALASFFTLWCFLITRSDASPGKIPYDAIHRFSPKIEMFAAPVPKFWVVRGDGAKVLYSARKRDDGRSEYYDDKKKPYSQSGVVAIELENKGGTVRLDKEAAEEGGYRIFRSADGWTMQEFENGPTGLPAQWRWGRFLGNLLLNLLHAALWFVCLWLLLHYRFNDALGMALVIWLIATLILVPMLLDQAAAIARDRIAAGSG